MIDSNKMVDELLCVLEDKGIRVFYQYPEDFETLPSVSYYNLITTEGFRADNAEQAQLSHVQVDIWAKKRTQPGKIAAMVNEIMQNAGWIRELSRDLPKETEHHMYHHTMRFAKEVYLGG